MFIDFLGVCFDQIFNQAAKFRYMFGGNAVTPVTFRTMYGVACAPPRSTRSASTRSSRTSPGSRWSCRPALFAEDIDLVVRRPGSAGQVLPFSTAPGVRRT